MPWKRQHPQRASIDPPHRINGTRCSLVKESCLSPHSAPAARPLPPMPVPFFFARPPPLLVASPDGVHCVSEGLWARSPHPAAAAVRQHFAGTSPPPHASLRSVVPPSRPNVYSTVQFFARPRQCLCAAAGAAAPAARTRSHLCGKPLLSLHPACIDATLPHSPPAPCVRGARLPSSFFHDARKGSGVGSKPPCAPSRRPRRHHTAHPSGLHTNPGLHIYRGGELR